MAENAAAVRFVLYEGAADARPRIRCSTCWRGRTRARTARRSSKAIYAHLLLAGNAYIEAVSARQAAAVRELYALRPDRMRVVPGPDGWPEAYDYTAGGPHACASIRARAGCRRSCI